MQKLLLFIFCYCFTINVSQAQKSVSKATITTQNNEEIEVFIRNSTYEGTPQSFEYSTGTDGKYKTISVDDIRKIIFDDGTVYEKKKFLSPACKLILLIAQRKIIMIP